MSRVTCSLFAVALAFTSMSCGGLEREESTLRAEDAWTGWRGPERDGKSKSTGIAQDWEAKPPKLLWMRSGMGSGYASVSLADGMLFTTGNFGDGQAVVAADLASGRVQWKTKITDRDPKHGYDGSRTTPTLDGERLYVVASSGKIVCVNINTHDIEWQRDFKDWNGKMMSGWGFSESPLVDGDWVLCTHGGPEAMIVCLDKRTGEDVWQCAMPSIGPLGKNGAGYSSIVISHGAGVKQYVQLVGRGVIGVRAAD